MLNFSQIKDNITNITTMFTQNLTMDREQKTQILEMGKMTMNHV